MGHSQAEKAQNRERILAEASRQVRREGLESVGVGTLMRSVGLTHGGFYGHFESRDDLLTEALERALLEGEAKAGAHGSGTPPPFPDIVRSYLSRAHRDARDSGCAVAALVSDVARASEGHREVMAAHVESFIGSVATSLGGDEERAIMAVSAMVGALTLSRVMADPARSNIVLKVVREHLLRDGVALPEASSPHAGSPRRRRTAHASPVSPPADREP
jgi:TetR/AcrR family transcriptional regulator, transcriptional repressor for nem operon